MTFEPRRDLQTQLSGRIRTHARQLGFDAVGISPAQNIPPERLREWLERGFQGEMAYLNRQAEKKLEPAKILDGIRSIISVALNYYHPYPLPYERSECGVISRYASGADYHDVMAPRLEKLAEFVGGLRPGTRIKLYVDTGPVMDKHWAVRSGLGWLGKHTNVLSRRLGSWFFIGELLLDLELEYDDPGSDFCGSCTRCIEACPTGAIVEPYVLDSRLCISYLTIEHRSDIPEGLRPLMGNLIYGCDICQDVCPWNRQAPVSGEAAFSPRPGSAAPLLGELAGLSPQAFAERFRGSPIKRTKWRGLMRNVAVALGNSSDPGAVEPLTELLETDDPLVRRHAAWALHRIGTARAAQALRNRLDRESDPELRRLLAGWSDPGAGNEPSV